MKKCVLMMLLSSAALLLCSCTSTPEEQPRKKMALGVPHGKIKYQPVDGSNLRLRLFGQSTLRAGRTGTLTFALANTGHRKIEIPEWFSHEPDNVVIYMQPWLDGMVEPDEKRWTKLDFNFKRPIFHYPLILMPGNQALVSKTIPVVEKLMIPPGGERRFFVRAELTLESLKLSTDIIMLRVLPNQVI